MRFGIYIPEKRSRSGKLRRPVRWYNDGRDNGRWVWGPAAHATVYPSYKAAHEAILREGIGRHAKPDSLPAIAVLPEVKARV